MTGEASWSFGAEEPVSFVPTNVNELGGRDLRKAYIKDHRT